MTKPSRMKLWSHRLSFRRDFHTMEQSRQNIVRRPPLEAARFEVGLTRAGQQTAQAGGRAGRMMLLIPEHDLTGFAEPLLGHRSELEDVAGTSCRVVK